ncbi:beta-galactosidase [Candidatus Oscillochloris fontis]|uniref:beta-galactosidase n=1 Tax=Candidatus Oscillochloris fontis TaxID=2496868 RepID=UPI00101DA88F|nr:beta-galactosidase [Candidatus Oscillochloris fontis]
MIRQICLLLLLVPLLSASSPLLMQPPPRFVAPLRIADDPPSFGLNSHVASRYPDPSSMAAPAQMLSDLGVTWVREDFQWHRIEPSPGAWEWTFTDMALQLLHERGIQVLGVLGPSVGWATPEPGDGFDAVSYYPPDPAAFDAYVRAVVERYHPVVQHWEIWNEPDYGIFWQPEPDVAAYTRLLIQTAATIRSIDPHAQVVLGGINPFDTAFLRGVAEHGGWGSFDILAVHPYVDPYGPEEGNLISALDGVRTVLAHYGQKPIWATEVGWASGPGDRDALGMTDAEEQANYLVRSMLILWRAGVERIFWYSFKDDPHNPYGLLRAGWGRGDLRERKPAYTALRTLNYQLAGTKLLSWHTNFDQIPVMYIDRLDAWQRTSQPNGSLRLAPDSPGIAAIEYRFTTRQNDYVVFERQQPLVLPGQPYGLGIWVDGDASGHRLKVWLRDAEGERLQYLVGVVAGPGWQLLTTPLVGSVEATNRLVGSGNQQLDFPVSLEAIVLEDREDRYVGTGSIRIGEIVMITGPEVYDLRLQRGDQTLAVVWAPTGALWPVRCDQIRSLVARDGAAVAINPCVGRFDLYVGSAPRYLTIESNTVP